MFYVTTKTESCWQHRAPCSLAALGCWIQQQPLASLPSEEAEPRNVLSSGAMLVP